MAETVRNLTDGKPKECLNIRPSAYLLFCGTIVLFIVKFFKQEEKHDCVHSNPPDKRSRIIAVDKE